MTHERGEELEELGFKWSVDNFTWEDRFEQLKTYGAHNGHVNVPANNGVLGTFVKAQRYLYKLLREGKYADGMTYERAKKLEGLGFKWSVRNSSRKRKDDRVAEAMEK